jgi:adenylate cyclase
MLPSTTGAIDPPADAAIVFTDLRGFTTLSERLDSTEVARWLDGFFTRMSEAILSEGGTIDKLLGDGVLAVFGVTEPLDNPSAAAFRAALRMQRALAEINRSAPIHPGTVLRMGVGIHRGPVVGASLGGRTRRTYTVIGDVVNTAQRIESLTKSAGYPILVSRAVHESLAPADRRDGVLLGTFELAGKEERLDLFGYEWRPAAT